MTECRRIINIHEADFTTYDLEGPVQDDIQLLNISFNQSTGKGWYVIRMDPGSETIAHKHQLLEEFLILEGELIESDGAVLKPGDFVSYPPGTYHNSRTEKGCLLIGIDRDP
jgi:mannose-6-phosphate isomerase-like protein (cupin superfamily)